MSSEESNEVKSKPSGKKRSKLSVKSVLRKANASIRRIAKPKKRKKVSPKSRKRQPRNISIPSFVPPTKLMAHPEAPSAYVDHRVPSHYNEDTLVLMIRDPWWMYAYWEITPTLQNSVMECVKQSKASDWKMVLRVYDVTLASVERPNSYFDIDLNFYTDNWYIDVGVPDRSWVAELGYRTNKHQFFKLIRSNTVRTPAFGMSEILDEEWMLPEEIYYQIIGYSIHGSHQQGSMDIRRLLERYLKNVVSSERLQQPARLA